jgi:hypothetical protein
VVPRAVTSDGSSQLIVEDLLTEIRGMGRHGVQAGAIGGWSGVVSGGQDPRISRWPGPGAAGGA